MENKTMTLKVAWARDEVVEIECTWVTFRDGYVYFERVDPVVPGLVTRINIAFPGFPKAEVILND